MLRSTLRKLCFQSCEYQCKRVVALRDFHETSSALRIWRFFLPLISLLQLFHVRTVTGTSPKGDRVEQLAFLPFFYILSSVPERQNSPIQDLSKTLSRRQDHHATTTRPPRDHNGLSENPANSIEKEFDSSIKSPLAVGQAET